MRKLFGFILLFLSWSMAFAQVESVIEFRGQNAEVIKVDEQLTVSRPQQFQVQSTCQRDIPYESRECRNEIRYREQCQWIPPSQRCWTDTRRVCQNVTRTRRECSAGPSTQVCRDVPGRQVCTQQPTREVCRTDSNGQRRCTTVGGNQVCNTVGGGRECSSVPGPEICRNVAYSTQDCNNVPYQRCEGVPGRNQCRQVDYIEQVCGNVTRYRQESYACTKTETRNVPVEKKIAGDIEVQFKTNGIVEEFPLKVNIVAKNPQPESFDLEVSLGKNPKEIYVILLNKNLEVKETADEISLSGEINLELIQERIFAPVFPSQLSSAVFNKKDSTLSMVIEGQISAFGDVKLRLENVLKNGQKKLIALVSEQYPGPRVKIEGNKLIINLKDLMKNSLSKKNQLSLQLSVPAFKGGVILNNKRPELEKSYQMQVKR
jgi:RNase P/RNase MRP subunit p29